MSQSPQTTKKISLFPLHEGQKRVKARAKKRNVLACARRWGKTTMGIDLAIEIVLDKALPVGYFALTDKNLAESFDQACEILAPAIAKYNKSDRFIQLRNGGKLEYWSLVRPDLARGRKYGRAIIDEAAFADGEGPGLRYAWQKVISATLIDLSGDAWIMSSPDGDVNYFAQLYDLALADTTGRWAAFQLPTSDNPLIPRDEIEAARRELPDEVFRQEFLAEFLSASAGKAVIPVEWVKLAMARWEASSTPVDYMTAMGVDVARGGKDQTVIAKRYGSWVDRLERYPGRDTPDGPTVAALVVAAAGSDGPLINVDVIGVGGSVYDHLLNYDLPVTGVNVASRSEATDKSGKLKFINLRAEIYWKLREALDPSTGENLALPPDPLLLQDLTAPQWSLTVSGIKVESKDDIKKRIGRSTDSGDAVALACYSGSYGEKDKVQAGSLAIFGVNPYGNTGGNERNTTGPGGNYYSRRGW